MKQPVKYIIALISLSFIAVNLHATFVNPQPGQNLWNVTAAIGTELDQLVVSEAASFAGTFTAIAAVSNIIASDFNQTWTILNAGFACVPTPITSSTTIATSGAYCLANDITGPVAITASNVTFDLDGHTISGGANGVTVSGSQVVVENGTIQNSTSSGILLTGSKCKVSNCLLVGCANGLSISSGNENSIVDCRAIDNTTAGFSNNRGEKNIFQSCQAIDTTSSGSVYGFVTSFGSGNIFVDCKENGVTSTGIALGTQVAAYAFLQGEVNSQISGCTANNTSASAGSATVNGIIIVSGTPQLDPLPAATFDNTTIVSSVDWLTVGSNYYLAMGGANIGGAPQIRVLQFNPTTQALSALTTATFDNTAHVNSVGWLTVGSNYYLAMGGVNIPAGPEIRVLQFNPTTQALSALTTATFENTVTVLSVNWLTVGSNYYLAMGGVNIAGPEIRVFQFNPTTQALSELTTARFDNTVTVVSVDWLTAGSKYYLAMGGLNIPVGPEIRVLQFSEPSNGCMVDSNIVYNTSGGAGGIGYQMNVDANMLIDNIAFNNTTNYLLTGNTYNINNRP